MGRLGAARRRGRSLLTLGSPLPQTSAAIGRSSTRRRARTVMGSCPLATLRPRRHEVGAALARRGGGRVFCARAGKHSVAGVPPVLGAGWPAGLRVEVPEPALGAGRGVLARFRRPFPRAAEGSGRLGFWSSPGNARWGVCWCIKGLLAWCVVGSLRSQAGG